MEDDHIFLFFFSRIEEKETKKKKIRAWPIEQFFTQCGRLLAQSLHRRTNTEKKRRKRKTFQSLFLPQFQGLLDT
jgi:hypothetical protein